MMIIIVYAASRWRHCFKVHGRKIVLFLWKAHENVLSIKFRSVLKLEKKTHHIIAIVCAFALYEGHSIDKHALC
jgi:hypothetical protein